VDEDNTYYEYIDTKKLSENWRYLTEI